MGFIYSFRVDNIWMRIQSHMHIGLGRRWYFVLQLDTYNIPLPLGVTHNPIIGIYMIDVVSTVT